MEKPITELTEPGKRHSCWCDDNVASEVLATTASLLSLKLLESTLVPAFSQRVDEKCAARVNIVTFSTRHLGDGRVKIGLGHQMTASIDYAGSGLSRYRKNTIFAGYSRLHAVSLPKPALYLPKALSLAVLWSTICLGYPFFFAGTSAPL
jgi:hypothetical protein